MQLETWKKCHHINNNVTQQVGDYLSKLQKRNSAVEIEGCVTNLANVGQEQFGYDVFFNDNLFLQHRLHT